MSRIIPIFFLLIITHALCEGQDSTRFVISGHAFSATNPSERLEDLMIINLATSQGIFGKADGTFNAGVHRHDTILVASTGFEYFRIPVSDSLLDHLGIRMEVPLIRLHVKLKEVVIFSSRDLESIYRQIEKLGYKKSDYEIEGVNAIESPITFLYQEFSRFERLRRHNAELVNNEKRRDLLKDLLANYVNADIINLENSEFDDFVTFCNVPEDLMKNSSQYDFCIYIKRKFELYKMMQDSGRK